MATRDFLRDQLRELTDELAARSSDGVDFDPEARERRAERERKAERKKRRELRAEETPAPAGLGEPFVGDDDSG